MRRSVVIPAHNEEATIAMVVRAVRSDSDDIIVVASCCTDRTAAEATAAGARVTTVETLGKHYAIRRGLQAAAGDLVAFVDGDLVEPQGGLAGLLFEALSPGVSLAKGFYNRTEQSQARLTEICARPLLSLLRPSLAGIHDPLSGEYAVRRDLVRRWAFAPGFAVDLGFLLAAEREGEIREVNLGVKQHRHRSVLALGQAAVQVAATLLGTTTNSDCVVLPQPIPTTLDCVGIDIRSLPPLDPDFMGVQ